MVHYRESSNTAVQSSQKVQTTQLTLEQRGRIPAYREKWSKYTLLNEPINKQEATNAINSWYKFVGRNEPEIIFGNNPKDVYLEAFWHEISRLFRNNDKILSKFTRHWQETLEINPENYGSKQNITSQLRGELRFAVQSLTRIRKRLCLSLEKIRQGKSRAEALSEAQKELFSEQEEEKLKILNYLDSYFFARQKKSWIRDFYQQLEREIQLPTELWVAIADLGGGTNIVAGFACIDLEFLTSLAAEFDFCLSVLKFPSEPQWEVIQGLVKSGRAIIFPYESTVYLLDLPVILNPVY